MALFTRLGKTQNFVPLKSESKILILSSALSAFQATTFQIRILEKIGLSE